jgi:sigma-54 specific flagellar transcriptional regulator A
LFQSVSINSFPVSIGRQWQKSSKMWTIEKWQERHIRYFFISSAYLIQINHKVSSELDCLNRSPSIRTTHSMTLTPHPLIGQSEAMRSTRALIQTLAPSLSSVLIHGESGTGKELIAQALHAQGPRRSGPFVPINCGAIPRELLESELFGHRKGAFTGAVGERMGRFEMANGGTIFLDEIGDLPLDMQVKLLRVLQERQIEPLGSNKSVPIDVRVIAATHKDLEKDIAEHKFREDLYYRLNVLPVRTSPLRERPEDIPELMAFFLAKFTPTGMKPLVCAGNLMQALQRYPWPGNIRELSNIADRFSALYAGQNLDLFAIPEWLLPKGLAAIRSEMPAPPPPIDLPQKSQAAAFSGDDAMQALLDPPEAVTLRPVPAPMVHVAANDALDPALAILSASNIDEGNPVEDVIRLAMGMDPLLPDGISLRDKLIDIERSYIEQALQRTDWNVSQTARILSLQRTTLIEKINKYGFKRA